MVDSNRQLAEVNSQLEKLESENRRLSGQVKRLLMAEWDLSRLQGQLDTQIRLYRQLYEVGKIFNATFDLGEILETATRFVLYELNFERCLVLLRSESDSVCECWMAIMTRMFANAWQTCACQPESQHSCLYARVRYR
jgi:hypothetical protein